MPQGVIVLEGADCSGKTTLARELQRTCSARYLHNRVWPDMWRYHTASLRLAERWASAGDLVVIDRLFLSELTYGRVFRGAPAYDLGARCLDRLLQRVGATTVLCVPSDREWQLRNHRYRSHVGAERFGNIERVVDLYHGLRSGATGEPAADDYLSQLTSRRTFGKREDVYTYDASDGRPLRLVVEEVLGHLAAVRGIQYRPALDHRRPNVLGGRLAARFLFVGEALGRPNGASRWPFYAPDQLSSATWLNRALRRVNFNETHAMWTNACDPDDHLRDLLALRLTPVAIGSAARARLEQLGVPVPTTRAIPHPQWHCRFHHHQFDEYVTWLEGCLI